MGCYQQAYISMRRSIAAMVFCFNTVFCIIYIAIWCISAVFYHLSVCAIFLLFLVIDQFLWYLTERAWHLAVGNRLIYHRQIKARTSSLDPVVQVNLSDHLAINHVLRGR